MFGIVFPWYVRMAIDTAIIVAPFVYLSCNLSVYPRPPHHACILVLWGQTSSKPKKEYAFYHVGL